MKLYEIEGTYMLTFVVIIAGVFVASAIFYAYYIAQPGLDISQICASAGVSITSALLAIFSLMAYEFYLNHFK